MQVSAGAGDGGWSFTLCQFPPGNLYLISNDLAQRPIRLSQRLQRCGIRLRCVLLRRSAHGKSVSMRHRAACSSAAEASASRVVVPGRPTEFAVKRIGVMIVKQYARRGTRPLHLSSRHKAAHHTHKNVANPTTLGLRVQDIKAAGGQRGKCLSCRKHAAPQEALQLQRWELNLHVAGQGWRQQARALGMDAERSKDQLAREKLLQAEKRVLEIDKTCAPAEVVI